MSNEHVDSLPPNTVNLCKKADTNNEEKGADFEDILDKVGSSGRWQVFIFCLTCLTGYFTASQHLGQMYLGMTPDHWCSLPQLSDMATGNNWTTDKLKLAMLPVTEDGKPDTCHIYVRNYTAMMELPWSSNISQNLSKDTVGCQSWQYNTSQISSSFVTEWDLVCDRRVLLSTVQAMYMAGVLFGAVTHGYLSDRFGRRKIILIGMVEFCTGSIMTSFSTYYGVLLFLRFVTGSGAAATFGVSFVLITECCGINIRDLVGCAFEVTFPMGYMVLAGLAYAIRDWSNLQLAVAVPSLVLVCYYWLLPESPRWLVQKGDFKSALPIIKRMAKVNGANGISDADLTHLMSACHKRSQMKESHAKKIARKASLRVFLDLFRTRQMLKQILICYVMWCSASMGYYGLSFNSPAIASNPYYVTVINGVMEIVAYIVCYFIIKYLGRKISICSMYLVGGTSCLLVLAVPTFSEYNWAIMMLTLIGKFCITIVYAILYLYTMEIFPTNNRNVALGTSSMFARIGSMSSPYILDVVAYRYGKSLPNIIFGLTAVLSGILSIFLPESKGRCMPDTPDDVEKGLRVGNTSNSTDNGTFTLI